MTKIVLLDAQLSIDNNDLTDWTSKIELSDEFEAKKTTTFGSGGAEENEGGLESFEAAIQFKQDYDAAGLDEIMWALRRQVVTFAARAMEEAVSASNPQYSGSILINKWVPIAGNVGDVGEVDVTYPGSGPLARATST
jgi:hypothetical protein